LWGNRVGPTQKGLWTDPVTGMSYARARWYDARNAHWLSEDPLGAVDSTNLYAFVGWQPNMGVDPLGLGKPVQVQTGFTDAYTVASSAALGPGYSWDERVALGTLALAVAPAAGLEQILNGFFDTPFRMIRNSHGVIREVDATVAAKGGKEKLRHGARALYHGCSLLLDTTIVAGSTEAVVVNVMERQTLRRSTVESLEAGSCEAAESEQGAELGESLNLRAPAKRHWATRVGQSTLAKNMNTVIEPGVDVAGDVAKINAGLAQRTSESFVVDSRIYAVHGETLYPVSGPGFHQLNRGAFKALGVFNTLGRTLRATEILDRMGISMSERAAAAEVWEAIQ